MQERSYFDNMPLFEFCSFRLQLQYQVSLFKFIILAEINVRKLNLAYAKMDHSCKLSANNNMSTNRSQPVGNGRDREFIYFIQYY